MYLFFFYSPEYPPKAVVSLVDKPRVKIPLLVFMSEMTIDLTQKKSNFLFLLCFKLGKKSVYSNASAITTETQRFTSNWMGFQDIY